MEKSVLIFIIIATKYEENVTPEKTKLNMTRPENIYTKLPTS